MLPSTMLPSTLAVLIAVAYLAAGAVWSLYRWRVLLRRMLRLALELKAKVYLQYDIPSDTSLDEAITFLAGLLQNAERGHPKKGVLTSGGARIVGTVTQRREAFEDGLRWCARADSTDDTPTNNALEALRGLRTPPSAGKHKGTITLWIGLWPVSLLWYLVDEPVRKVYNWLRSTYQRIADSMWKAEGL